METLLLVKYWWIIFHITNSYLRREPPAIILPWAAWQPDQCGCSICLGEKQENLYFCRDSVLEVGCPCECCLGILNIRYDEEVQGIEEGYPQDMRNWRGVPSHIDGAITWNDGRNITQKCLNIFGFPSGVTYFFKNDKFWRFDDHMVITESELPMETAAHWFQC